jgi:hypothetical protein
VWPRPSGALPHRETLSHLEQGDWPAGIDGEPTDPWRNTRYFWLVNPATAETFTYTNSTYGTRLAYEELGSAVATMRKVHRKAAPIVELSATPMKTKRGTKQRPHFAIVGWKGVGTQDGTVEQRSIPAKTDAAQLGLFGDPPQIENDMNDAVPF